MLSDALKSRVYADELTELCLWLKEYEVTSVAMESTGNYRRAAPWQNLYVELVRRGFEVVLCNGKFTKHAKGKKTDIKDCRWIQKLHALGLLTSSFLPDELTEQLRTYCRQRSNWIELAAEASHKMQKYLKLLNFRLDVVVKDICKGNLDAEKLAEHRHYNCKKSKEEIAHALKGNNRKDYLFCLKQEYESYLFYQKKIDQCDRQISKFLKEQIHTNPEKAKLVTEKKPHKRVNKNAIKHLDLNQAAYQYFEGVDLMKIEGMSHATILTIMSEIGPEGFKKFASWLRLAPNNKISGGKVLSSRIPKGSNRLKIALRQAANAIGNLKDTHLSNFFKRVAFRKGRQAAVSATARKLAVILWNMITKKVQYNPPTEYLFLDQKRKLKLVERIRKKVAKLDLKPEDLGFVTT